MTRIEEAGREGTLQDEIDGSTLRCIAVSMQNEKDMSSGYEKKFAGFIKLCTEAKAGGLK